MSKRNKQNSIIKVKLYDSNPVKQLLTFCTSQNGFAKGDRTSNAGFKIGAKHAIIELT